MRVPIQNRRPHRQVLELAGLRVGARQHSDPDKPDATSPANEAPVPVSLWPVVMLSPTSTTDSEASSDQEEEEEESAPAYSLGLPSPSHHADKRRLSAFSTYTQSSFYSHHSRRGLVPAVAQPSSPGSGASDVASDQSPTLPVQPWGRGKNKTHTAKKSSSTKNSSGKSKTARRSRSQRPPAGNTRPRWDSTPSSPQSLAFTGDSPRSFPSSRRSNTEASSVALASPTLVAGDWKYQVTQNLLSSSSAKSSCGGDSPKSKRSGRSRLISDPSSSPGPFSNVPLTPIFGSSATQEDPFANDTVITVDFEEPGSPAPSYLSSTSRQANWQAETLPKKQAQWFRRSQDVQALYAARHQARDNLTDFHPDLDLEQHPFATAAGSSRPPRQSEQAAVSRDFLPLSQRPELLVALPPIEAGKSKRPDSPGQNSFFLSAPAKKLRSQWRRRMHKHRRDYARERAAVLAGATPRSSLASRGLGSASASQPETSFYASSADRWSWVPYKIRLVPPNAVLFALGFLFLPCWWLGSFYPRVKNSREFQDLQAHLQANASSRARSDPDALPGMRRLSHFLADSGLDVPSGPFATYWGQQRAIHRWRQRNRLMSLLSVVILIVIIVVAAVLA